MGRPPCCDKVGIKKGPWTPEEDIILVSYIQEHGPGNWRSVPTNTGLLRCSKSCRLRWTNYLRPGIKRGNFTSHEEGMIIHLQALLGNKWAAIASYLPQRTDNDIKNYWNTHLKKKLKKLQSAMDSQDQSESSTCHLESSETLLGINKGSSSTYASSTENISRLLEGWMRSSPITTDQKERKIFEINSNGGLMGSLSSSSSSSRIQILGLKSDSRDEFDDSIISFENLKNGSCSWDDKEINVGEEKLKQRSENSSPPSPPPLSFLEKWLFEETGAAQVEELMELSPVF